MKCHGPKFDQAEMPQKFLKAKTTTINIFFWLKIGMLVQLTYTNKFSI